METSPMRVVGVVLVVVVGMNDDSNMHSHGHTSEEVCKVRFLFGLCSGV